MKILLYNVYQNQTMVKDTQFNLRVESTKIEQLKKNAEFGNTTPAKIISKIIDDILSGQATIKDTKIEVLENEIKEMQSKFEKEFDKKIPKTHRVSIGVTAEEFMKLQKLATKTNTTKSKALRQILEQSGTIRALK